MEAGFAGLLVLDRLRGGDQWTASNLTGFDVLDLPEAGIGSRLPISTRDVTFET